MNALQLVKHHGFGNDFLIAFHVDAPDVDLAALARAACDRRRGVGADGLLIGDSDPRANARMALFNADGSRAEISGNGVRCFAHALAVRRGGLSTLTIRTDAGIRRVERFENGFELFRPHRIAEDFDAVPVRVNPEPDAASIRIARIILRRDQIGQVWHEAVFTHHPSPTGQR